MTDPYEAAVAIVGSGIHPLAPPTMNPETVSIRAVDGLTVTGRFEPEEPVDRRVHGYSLGHPGSPARFIATSAALHGHDITPLLTNADGIDYTEVMTWLEEQALKDRE